MIHHTLKAEVIREMITSKCVYCVCSVVWFGMCVGFVCVKDWEVGAGMEGVVCEGI